MSAAAADEKTIARFWSKVDRDGDAGCWLWKAGKSQRGYGRIKTLGFTRYAHRVAWELAHGPIPPGVGHHGTCVCHRCDVPACVNPDHLFLGTMADNTADRDAKGRARHPSGEAHGMAKLTNEQVAALRSDRVSLGLTYTALGAKYGIHESQAHHLVNGRRRRVKS